MLRNIPTLPQEFSSGGSRIYKRGGHKIMDLLSITKTSKWEVVKNSASLKRLFFFGLHAIFPTVQIVTKHTFSSIFWPQISLFHLFLNSTPTSNPKRGGGGAHSTCLFIFLLGHAHIWPKRGGGGGMCLKCGKDPAKGYAQLLRDSW